MAMNVAGVVRNVQAAFSSAPGLPQSLRLGNQNDLIQSKAHGDLYEGAYGGQRFGGAMQTLLATPTIAGLGTSITGVSVLINPNGNKFNVAIERVGLGFVVAPAAPLVFGLATGQSTTAVSGTTTTLNPKSKNIGSGFQPTAQLIASAAITLPVAPTVDTVLGQLDQGAVTVTNSNNGMYDLKGSIILPPGGFACLWTSAVLAALAHIMSWDWEEVPV